jgi:hypothetical protein
VELWFCRAAHLMVRYAVGETVWLAFERLCVLRTSEGFIRSRGERKRSRGISQSDYTIRRAPVKQKHRRIGSEYACKISIHIGYLTDVDPARR